MSRKRAAAAACGTSGRPPPEAPTAATTPHPGCVPTTLLPFLRRSLSGQHPFQRPRSLFSSPGDLVWHVSSDTRSISSVTASPHPQSCLHPKIIGIGEWSCGTPPKAAAGPSLVVASPVIFPPGPVFAI